MIPEAAVEAAARRQWLDSALGRRTCDAWEALTELEQTLRKDDARAALEAAAPHMLAEAIAQEYETGAAVLGDGIPIYASNLRARAASIRSKS